MSAVNAAQPELNDDDQKRLEWLLVEFDQHWCDGSLAKNASRLEADSPLRARALSELIKIDLERQSARGRPATIETYLTTYPELGTPETVAAELIHAEYQVRRQFGESANLDEYCRRFPRQAAALCRLIEESKLVVSDTELSASNTCTVSFHKSPSGSAPPDSVHEAATQPSGQPSDSPAYGAPAAAGSTHQLTEKFGRYRILKCLGQGGMGAVYLAHDMELDRQVAMKIPHFAEDAGTEVLERFYRESRAAATLDHPNICPVYDVGRIDGIHYLVMAYIDGKPLSEFAKPDKPIPQRQVAAIIRKLALALQEAHDHGVVHRDLKPANIMVNKRRELVIMDFGLARLLKKPGEEEARLTQSGAVMGTPMYMSPEQVMGDTAAIGPATDIYSLGVIMYELLTGRPPFRGLVTAVLAHIVVDEPARPSSIRMDIDPALETICLKAMAKKIDARYTSMSDLATALGEYLNANRAASVSEVGWVESARPTDLKSEISNRKSQVVGLEDPAQPTPPPSDHRARTKRIGAVAAAFIIAALGFAAFEVYRIETDYGMLVVEINDEQVAAKLKNDGLVIEDAANSRGFNITAAGPHPGYSGMYRLPEGQGLKLLVLDDTGLEVATNEFKLTRGGNVRVRVTMEDAAVPAGAVTQSASASRDSPPQRNPDPDRRAAKWVINSGGTVAWTGGDPRGTNDVSALPTSPFRAQRIGLLRSKQVTDAGLAHLQNLTELESLDLGGARPFTDAGLAHLRGLSNLHDLNLTDTSLTNAGLPHLKGLAKLKRLSICETQVDDDGLQHIAALQQLDTLALDSTRITDAGLVHIRGLKNLTNLSLWETGVTDDGLKSLEHFSRLHELNLGDRITDAGLIHLRPLTQLRRLSFWRTQLSDSGLKHLQELKRLEHLGLGPAKQITGEGLAHLTALPALRTLELDETGVTDAALVHVKGLPNLEHLGLNSTPVGDYGLEHLAGLTKLVMLKLSGTKVTDAGLASLHTLQSLREMDLRGTKLTAASVQKLAATLPQCWIHSDHGTLGPGAPLTADPGRRAAEAMLRFGNVTIRVAGELRHIDKVDNLPIENFHIEEIHVVRNDRIANDDLEVLSGLPSLRAIGLLDTPRVTDAGVVHLRDLRGLNVLNLVGANLTDACLDSIEAMPGLNELFLGVTQVSDAGLARLRGLSQLTLLDVGKTRVTDAGTVYLRELTRLRTLGLNDNKVSDIGLANIKVLSRLRSLTLANTQVTSVGLEHLADLTELETLVLNGTNVTDAGLDHLKKLVRLRAIGLAHTAVTDAGLAALRPLTNLGDLNLGSARGVTDSGLEQLKGLTALFRLNLSDTLVTDAGLENLKGLTKLEELSLERTRVTAAGVRELHDAIPQCQILADFGTFDPKSQ
jgi:serine/threonine protein kinase/Leucine-rich repeat (LRR) protein